MTTDLTKTEKNEPEFSIEKMGVNENGDREAIVIDEKGDKHKVVFKSKSIEEIWDRDLNMRFDQIMVLFLLENPFYTLISRYIRKCATRSLPTLAVTYHNGSFTLYWNPDFFFKLDKGSSKKNSQDNSAHDNNINKEKCGVILHEFYHLILRHITANYQKNNPVIWNIACDLASNSIIRKYDSSKIALPKGCLLPGEKIDIGDTSNLNEEEKKAVLALQQLILSFKKDQSAFNYFAQLMLHKDEISTAMPYFGFDCHDLWEFADDCDKMIADEKLKGLMQKAIREADSSQMWGNVPEEVRKLIRRLYSKQIDWREVLKKFVGFVYRGERTTTMKKINKRYPYIHPGTKSKHIAKLAIAIDQSGSVGDAELEQIFAVLGALTNKVSITVIPFDTCVDEKLVFEWRRGTKPELKRVKQGGTDFNAPTEYVNKQENRGRFDALLIATDGECSKPVKCNIRRGWIVVPNSKLLFETDEPVIKMTKKEEMAEMENW